MVTQIEINAVATFAVENLDYCADYEMDEGVFEVRGQRYYFERKRSCFIIHIGNEKHRLPRC